MKVKALRLVPSSVALVVAAGLSLPVSATDEHVPAMQAFADSTVKAWVANPELIAAINAQNAKNAGLSQADIDALDSQWRTEVEASSAPMIEGVLGNALSGFLVSKKEEAGGVVTEVFVMDAVGLNVGQSDVTSDYWQGDEAKWQKTYQVGPEAVFIDEVEHDESTQSFQSQLSMSVVDPGTGEVIGAITVGIDVDALM